MITLMEKHKVSSYQVLWRNVVFIEIILDTDFQSQYDRMVEEKDAELNEMTKKEEEAVAHAKSLV